MFNRSIMLLSIKSSTQVGSLRLRTLQVSMNGSPSPTRLLEVSETVSPAIIKITPSLLTFKVDGRTMLPSILGALQSIANNTLKLHYSAISYKPFISIVNMTADPSHPYTYQDFAGGLNNYASAMVLEVYSNNSIVMKYKNGTTDDTFQVLPLNSNMNTVDGFVNSMEVR
jgi:hypothetical protein